jgi:hypothetical protein
MLVVVEVLGAASVVSTSVFFFFLQAPVLLAAVGHKRERFMPLMMSLTKRAFFRAVPAASFAALGLAALASSRAGLGLIPDLANPRLLGATISAAATAVNTFVVVPMALSAGARAMASRKKGTATGSANPSSAEFAVDGGDKSETKSLHLTVVVFVLAAVAGSALHVGSLVGVV